MKMKRRSRNRRRKKDIVDGASTSSFNSTLQFTEKMAEIDTDK